MNVLMINGSPRVNGNTALALQEMKNVFEQEAGASPHRQAAPR